ncbi:hypothetical protein BB559_001423 [Furculomyces boomerangus]|uniref:Elongator complex protein 1 n=1 Tax=Furculomyces boomerangus TaxID=61424 RepID=A0A2T9Z1X2_9FUNG|nr:hypothetical protein BB559_001423 [Furculomyces boomerangus]
MKDLIISSQQIFSIENILTKIQNSAQPDLSQNAICLTVDTDQNSIYIISINHHGLPYLYRFSNDPKTFIAKDVTRVAELPVDLSKDSIVAFKYLSDTESIFVALRNGGIYSINISDVSFSIPDHNKQFNIIGNFDYGIKACEWSPDEELLTIVTGENKIIIINSEYDLQFEGEPLTASMISSGFVSVGWGKKETQFHGKLGKQAAQKANEAIITRISENDDKSPRISWRGDSSIFAVSFQGDDRRVIQVYSNDGTYLCSSEPIECLEQTISWKPSGSVIASTEKLEHLYRVVFYERNGLRHYEFNLPKNVIKVDNLYWNNNSSILAVIAQVQTEHIDNDIKNSTETVVQLWTCGNYHWYLKQEINSKCLGGIVNSFTWDVENPYLIHILATSYPTNSSTYIQLSLANIDNVSHVPSNQSSAVAVVSDNNKLLVTPFGISNVPPPMSLYSVDVNESLEKSSNKTIRSVALAGFGNGNSFATLLNDGKTINLYEMGDAVKSVVQYNKPKLLATLLDIDSFLSTGTFFGRQVVWPAPNCILVFGFVSSTSPDSSELYKDAVLQLSLSHDQSGIIFTSIEFTSSISCTSPALRLVNTPLTEMVILALSDGSLFEVKYGDELYFDRLQITLDDPTVHLDTVYVDSQSENSIEYINDIEDSSSNKRLAIVSLSNRNVLRINNEMVTPSCTSFYLRNDYLILTTTLHVLQFIPISDEIFRNTSLDFIANSELKRRIERGSVIVLVHPVSDSVVLQLPRGNLETIKPRALVLSNIKKYIDTKNFSAAFHTCRTNRVDFSIMYNYNKDIFVSNMENVIKQIGDVEYLCLLASSFATVPSSSPTGQKKNQSGNVANNNNNDLCQSFRITLESVDKTKYLQPILTCYVSEQPPATESALIEIKKLGDSSFEIQSESLSYLLFLVDLGLVYKAALGCYDLELALLVAQKGQSDPREYLTLLSKWNSVKSDSNYQKYLIDTYLQKPESGVSNLINWYLTRIKAGLKDEETPQGKTIDKTGYEEDDYNYGADIEQAWNKLTQYINKHELYEKSLKLFRSDNIEKTMKSAFGESLESEAESISSTIKQIAKASYLKLCSMYGTYLEEKRDYINAATLYVISKEKSKAVEGYEKAGKWSEALSLATSPKSGYTLQQVNTLATKLANNLVSSGGNTRYLDAAKIILEYTNQIEQGVQYYISGQAWSEAIRSCYRFGRVDLVEMNIYPSLIEQHGSLLSSIEELQSKLEGKINRLSELRSVPLSQVAASLLPISTNQGQTVDVDMMLDTASMASQFSVFTVASNTNTTVSKATKSTARSQRTSGSRMTSRNRRKEAKKKLRGRKGTIYEESYLVESINRSVVEILGLSQNDVPNMLFALMNFDRFDLANELSLVFTKLINTTNNCVDDVFDNQRLIVTDDDMEFDEQGNQILREGENQKGNTVGTKLNKPEKIGFGWKYTILDKE